MANAKELLLVTLKDLREEELKLFQWYLINGVHPVHPNKKIRKVHVENTGRCGTVDKMVETYLENGAVEITLAILSKLNQNQLAQELSDKYGVIQASDTAQPGGSTEAASVPREDAPRKAESEKLKSDIKTQYTELYEGTEGQGEHSSLNDIYTDLYVVKNCPEGMNTDHEVIKMETGSTRHRTADTPIKFNEMFSKRCTKVLTMGIAGIGKTVSVQKFALDWAEGKSNADIDFVFVIPLRELNLLKDEQYSLHELLTYLYPDLDKLNQTGLFDGKGKGCLFIFDGLDEFSKKLNFHQKKMSLTQKASVDVLLTNIITGALLPSAFVWITSRPAAADQIPLQYIHLVTEVRGFTDQLKEDFFKKRVNDDAEAGEIISHVKQSKTLYIMCYIPIFCWITFVVLQEMREVPKTLTQMYTYFLTIQLNKNDQKQNKPAENDTKKLLESHKSLILKLAELAFHQLMKGNVMFDEEDLMESGINVTEAPVYSGIFTGILKKESGFHRRKVYCFVHLTFQEFLAAVYVFYCYENKNMEELQVFKPQNREWSEDVPVDEFLKGAVDKAVDNQKGQLDLFLRFLMGISEESNQRLLQGLLTRAHSRSKETTEYIKELIKGYSYISTKRSINLFLCLSEMHDESLSREIEEFLNSEKYSKEKLSPEQCSTLACMFLTSAEVLEELNLKKYRTSDEGQWRLVKAVSVFRKALLVGCFISIDCLESLSTVLQSENSILKELDLSFSKLQDSGMEKLSDGLMSSNCILETLRLTGCQLTAASCEKLASALQLENSSLKELDLSYNYLLDSGVELLSAALKSSNCKLMTLRLAGCNFTAFSCEKLASSLKSGNYLKELELSNNNLQDSGVELLSAVLKSSGCKLEILRLTICNLGEKACANLGSALQSVNSSLKELDLSNNDLHDLGVELLSDGLKISHCKLDTLRLAGCMLTDEGCSSLASALKSNPSHLRELDLNYNHPGESGVKMLSDLIEDPQYKLVKLHVNHGGNMMLKKGLRKYFRFLTLDPNTANGHLCLSEQNRKVKWVKEDQLYPDHSDRFDGENFQVLSVESLTGRCYWEVELGEEDEADISVSYKGIKRKGGRADSEFGLNCNSWKLNYHTVSHEYFVGHNLQLSNLLPNSSKRIAVYLDWSAGILSFYGVSPNTHTLTHLHTFFNTFTEPLYAGIGLEQNSSVVLCDI